MTIQPPYRHEADPPVEGSPWMDAPLTEAFLSGIVNAIKRGDGITLKKLLPVEPPLPSVHHLLIRELREWFPRSHHLEDGWERVGDSDDEDAGSSQETYNQDSSDEVQFRKSGNKKSIQLTLNQEEENYLVDLAVAMRRNPKGINREYLRAIEPPLPLLYIEILAGLIGVPSSEMQNGNTLGIATQELYDPKDAQDDQVHNDAEILNGDPNLVLDSEVQETYDGLNQVNQNGDAQNNQYEDERMRQHEDSQYEDAEDQDEDDYPEEYESAGDNRDERAHNGDLEGFQDVDSEGDYEDSQDGHGEADEAPLRTMCKSFLFDNYSEIIDFIWIYLAFLRDINFHDLVSMHKMLQKFFKSVNISKPRNRIIGLYRLIY